MKTLVAFDLDDTLIPEVLFIKSGIHHIARCLHEHYEWISPQRVISCMECAVFTRQNHYSALESYLASESRFRKDIDMNGVVAEFRSHIPDPNIYHLSPSRHNLLKKLRNNDEVRLALITDGRSLTQRNKIVASSLYDYFDKKDILISEETGHDKNDPDNFLYLMREYSGIKKFHYVADNPAKDFRHPLKLGWDVHLSTPFPLMIHPQTRSFTVFQDTGESAG